jgi:PAS domain S-box-containing protein
MAADFSTLFDFLPIGAYRSRPDGTMLRANPALVSLNGYASEAEMLPAVRDIGREWYVEPRRREEFAALMARDGHVRGFVSEVYRHKTRERIWINENAHAVRDGGGQVLFYEGTVEDISEHVRAQAALAGSEALLRRVTALAPGVVFQVHIAHDGTRRYQFVSEGVHQLFGVTPAEVLADSRRLDGLRYPEDVARFERERLAADAEGRALVSELRVRAPDGKTRWMQVNSAPMGRDDAGTLRSGFIIDVSERKRAEAALRENEERWKLALEASGDGVWDWDLVSDREVFSQRFMQMYGYDGQEFSSTAREFDSRVHPDDAAQMDLARREHLAGRTPSYVNEHRVRCRDGRWKWILTRGLVIARDAAGRPLRMIGTHTDIDARRHAEALRLERDRAAAADRAKTELLSRISHELRTPLNALLGFTQLLDTDPATAPHQRAWVQPMLSSGRHLLALVDDVLELSSAQSGHFRLDCRAVDLGHLVQESWTMLAADARRAQVTLVDGLASRPPLWVHADARRLRQVLSNLLSNAVKYNLAHGRVVVDAAPDGGNGVRITIADNGRGMDAAQQARAFTPFDRLGAQHSSIEGTGLGLALTRQLVEAMGGHIALDSQPDRGSTFTVTLPAAAAPDAAGSGRQAGGATAPDAASAPRPR